MAKPGSGVPHGNPGRQLVVLVLVVVALMLVCMAMGWFG